MSTKIRWFFCEDDAQVLPFDNIFTSRNWSALGDIEVPLGEVGAGAARTWVDGSTPWVWRDNLVCGSADRFATGQLFSTREDFAPLNWGIPPCCDPSDSPPCPTIFEVGVSHPAVLYSLAVGIETLRLENDVATDVVFETMLGSPHTFRFLYPNNLLFPNVAVGWNERQVIVFIDGTQSWHQLFVLIIGAALAPIPVGGFAFHPIAANMGVAIHIWMLAQGVPLDLPITFAGHSLGGALAHYLEAKERLLRPDRQSAAITFGAPKMGDAAMSTLLAGHTYNLRTSADPVPNLPPDVSFSGFLRIPIPTPLGLAWSGYQKIEPSYNLRINGSIVPDLPFGIVLEDLVHLVEALSVGAWSTKPAGHYLRTYIDLLKLARFFGPATPPCMIDIAEIDGVETNFPDVLPSERMWRAVTFDVYRVGTAPPAAPAIAGLSGILYANFALRSEASEGDAAVGHFTHVLCVPYSTTPPDIRDDYNEGTRGANYDSIYIPDGTGNSLVVRFVELLLDGDPAETWMRIYLDRRVVGAAQLQV